MNTQNLKLKRKLQIQIARWFSRIKREYTSKSLKYRFSLCLVLRKIYSRTRNCN